MFSSINKFYLHIEAAPPESGLQIYGQKRQVLYWPVFLRIPFAVGNILFIRCFSMSKYKNPCFRQEFL